MTKLHRNWLLAAAVSAALTSTGFANAQDSVKQNAVEARQETQIWTTYALSPYLRAFDLEVAVQSGKATLSGTVDESVNKELAGEIAAGVGGIKQVDNNIVVRADHKPKARAPERSYGDMVDDATITTAIKSKLLWSKHTEGIQTEVVTKHGRVTLSGAADTKPAKDAAGRLARNTHGVVAVDNRLVVAGKKPGLTSSAKDASKEAQRGVSDGWITTKVMSTFLYSTAVDGHDIKVSTDSGIVTLVGVLSDGAERALAIELAQNVRGVKAVHAKALTF